MENYEEIREQELRLVTNEELLDMFGKCKLFQGDIANEATAVACDIDIDVKILRKILLERMNKSKVKLKVSAYVLSVSDENEIEVYLQKFDKTNCYDYDFKINAAGYNAIKIENNIEIGDEIFIDMPNSWDPGFINGGENNDKNIKKFN